MVDFNRSDSGRGSGCRGRLFLAIMIALIGYAMYISNSEKNPVTGEKQYVAISPDQEIKLGLNSAPEMSREMGGELPDSDPRTKLVQKMGKYIVENTEASKSPWKFQFHLLADNKTINAFALPGGQIFITLGLFNKLKTEAQLAGVLGHEIGHVIERHTAQQMAKSQLGQMLVLAVGTGASSENTNVNSPMVIASVVNQMFQLKYSRHDESQADEWGVKLLSKIGYDPKAMIQVMEIFKAMDAGGRTPELLQSHPNPGLRIEQIKAYLKDHPTPSNVTEGQNLKDLY